MKHKLSIIVAALLIFVLALGITLYPLISNYVNQKYASTIYTKYEEMIQNVDETELQEARSLAQSYNQALAPVSLMISAYRGSFWIRPSTSDS